MGRIRRSWDILKASWTILKTDKELIALPLFGLVGTLAVLAVFGAAGWFSLTETIEAGGDTSYEPSGLTYAIGVVGYLVVSVVGTFFTAALVHGAHERLSDGNPSVGSALRGASRRFPQIAGWALLAGTVGLVLQFIADKGFIGRMVANVLSFGWQVLTYLAVPVVVIEGEGPFASLRRCTDLFKRTWGENLSAQLGFGLIGFLFMLPGLAIAVVIGLGIPLLGIALGVVWVLVVSLVTSALNGIFRAALYHYATTGQVPTGYSSEAVTQAFVPKTGAMGMLR